MKWVAQMPQPVAMPAVASQAARAPPCGRAGAIEKVDRGEARQKADDPGEQRPAAGRARRQGN